MKTFESGKFYDENYYRKHCGDLPYERSEPHWAKFFGNIARKIADDFKPQSVLDVGCAIGMLVEAFRQIGVDAYGFDVSEWAIKQVPTEYAGFVKSGSVLDSQAVSRKFDIVVCIEVLEHLQPSEADVAVQNLCKWGDLVIFTSSPDNYDEISHFNVQQPGYWAEKFAQNGFVRVLSYDASYIAHWAQVFRREAAVFPSIARQYEDNLWIKTKQLHSQRESVAKLQRKLDEQSKDIESYKAESERLAQEIQAKQERILEEVSAKQKFQKEIERLQIQEENYSKLRQEYTNLQKEKMLLNKDYEESLIQLQAANQGIEKILNTKAWKAVNFWWKSKDKVSSPLSRKLSRLTALHNTTVHIWKNQGAVALASHISRFLRGERQNTRLISLQDSPVAQSEEAKIYAEWIKKNEPDSSALDWQRKNEREFKYRPLVSVLTPVYNTDKAALKKMIDSVLAQTYSNWELCVVDGNSAKKHVRSLLGKYARRDKRIKVKFLDSNPGISANSNEALKMADGEFIALLDHDDELSPDALYETVALLNRQPDADMIYSDEDKLNARGLRCNPYFKPDWSHDFFCSSMYTCHLGVYRKSLIEKIGGFRSDFDGAQDWDLVLRLAEQTDKIYHIPKVLYHWRQTAGSTALSLEMKDYALNAQIRAVAEHFERLNIKAEVMQGLAGNLLRVKRKLSVQPKVSIIIPTRDQVKLLRNCIASITRRSTYQNYEIIVVDNNSSEPETLRYFQEISEHPNIRVIEYPHQFNFAAINNFAVSRAAGELLLFLNNDTEVISGEWLEAMVEHAVRSEVGAVGARLLYSDGTVQHAGIIIGIGGVAGHSHKHFFGDAPGYFSRAKAIQNLSAVTAACMMVKRDVFESVGGFNEKHLAVAFNDVDFCLRIRQKNLLIVYTPYAELYHHESASRGSDLTPEKALRFRREAEYMLEVWKEELRRDPYYNSNLSLEKENFCIR